MEKKTLTTALGFEPWSFDCRSTALTTELHRRSTSSPQEDLLIFVHCNTFQNNKYYDFKESTIYIRLYTLPCKSLRILILSYLGENGTERNPGVKRYSKFSRELCWFHDYSFCHIFHFVLFLRIARSFFYSFLKGKILKPIYVTWKFIVPSYPGVSFRPSFSCIKAPNLYKT